MSETMSSLTTEGLRYMALAYIHLMEQEAWDEHDIRVYYAISMHPKMVALMSRGDEIEEAGK